MLKIITTCDFASTLGISWGIFPSDKYKISYTLSFLVTINWLYFSGTNTPWPAGTETAGVLVKAS